MRENEETISRLTGYAWFLAGVTIWFVILDLCPQFREKMPTLLVAGFALSTAVVFGVLFFLGDKMSKIFTVFFALFAIAYISLSPGM